MLRSMLVGCVALVAGSGIAAAAAQDDVKAAAEKLAAADNYSWKSNVQAAGGNNNRGGGPIEGKAEKDGYIVLTITRGDNTLEIVKKGDKVVIKTPDGWQTPADLGGGPNAAAPAPGGAPNPARFAARMAQNFQPPAKTAADLADGAKDLTASGDTITGQLTEEAAKKALAFGGRRGGPNANANANAAGPEITNPKGDVKFTVKDGTLAGYELHVTGSVSFNGNSRDVDRTTTVTISDVGSTKVEVPEEAKKKME